MIVDRYYFNRLSEEEKEIYTLLYKGVAGFEKEILIPRIIKDGAMVNRIFRAMTYDNPYFYYFNQTLLEYGNTPFGTVFFPQYFCSAEQVKTYNGRVLLHG